MTEIYSEDTQKWIKDTSQTYRNMLGVFGNSIEVQQHLFDKLDEGVATQTKDRKIVSRINTALPQVQPLFRELLNDKLKEISPDDKSYQDVAKQILDTALGLDKTSEALPQKFNDFYYDLTNQYAKTHQDTHYAVVEIDISNMGNANIAIGRENVDRAVSVIKNIYENNLSRNDNVKNPSNVSISSIRNGGDEIRFFVAGLTEEEIKSRIKNADDKVSNFTTSLGTDRLEHGKYTADKVKNQSDDKNGYITQNEYELRAGFNAGSGVYMLGGNKSREQVQESLNNQIDKSKELSGKQKLSVRQKNEEEQPVIAKELSETIDYKEIDRILSNNEQKYSIKDNQQLPESLRKDTPEIIIPTVQNDDLGAYDDFYIATLNKIDNLATRKGFNDKQVSLLKNLANNFINTHSSISGFKSAPAIIEALPRKAQGGDEPNILVEIEMTNVQGLNKKFNHEFANLIIQKTANILNDELSGDLLTHNNNVEDEIYDAGGGRFRLLTHGKSFDDIKSAIAKAGKRVSSEIDSKTPTEITQNTEINVEYTENDKRKEERNIHSLQHPKRHNEKGVSLLFSAVELNKDKAIELADDSKNQSSGVEYYLRSSESMVEAFSRQPNKEISKAEFDKQIGNEQRWMVGNSKANNGELVTSELQSYMPKNMQDIIEQQTRVAVKSVAEAMQSPESNIQAHNAELHEQVNKIKTQDKLPNL